MGDEWSRLQAMRSAKPAAGVADSARILNVSFNEYHRDPLPEPSLSKSIAKLMLSPSCPRRAWAAHPRLGGYTGPRTRAQDEGTIIHMLLLGKGDDVVEIDADSYRTNAAKAARDAAEACGKIPVLAERMGEIKDAANHLREELAQGGYVFNGQSEVPFTWRERLYCSDVEVTCRGMFDHLFLSEGVAWDLKKVASAHPDECAKHIANYAGDIQHAAYLSGLVKLNPRIRRPDFVFLFVEIEPPYCWTAVRLDGQFRALGQAKWDRAVRLWHECISRGKEAQHWPGYADGVATVSPKPWELVRAQEEGMEISE